MKYLAIDYGQKRTGIAVSDTGGSMAFPRKTILMRTRAAFFEELLALIEAEATDAIVIGLPINLDGEESLTTRQVRNFSKSLARRTTYVEETGILIAVDEILAEKRIRHIESFIASEPESCKLTSGANKVVS